MKTNIKKYFIISTFSLGTFYFFQNCAPMPQFEVLDMSSTAVTNNLPISHPEISEKVQTTQKNSAVSREFIVQVLQEIFSSTQNVVPNLQENLNYWVTRKSGAMGGSCNLYDSNTTFDCGNDSANTLQPLNLEASSLRASTKVQICEQILSYDQAVYAALEKVNMSSATPNQTNLSQLYSLFRRGWDADPSFVTSLIELDRSLAFKRLSNLERWRAILLVVCEDPFWEYP